MSSGVNWESYRIWLGFSDTITNEAELARKEALESLFNGIVDDPSYQASALINDVNIPIVARRKSTKICAFKVFPENTVCIGDIVECFDETWIVVELYIDEIGMYTGEMWLCNYNIKFQNFSTTINSMPSVVEDGSYSKLSGNAKVITQDNTFEIYMSMNALTQFLYVDKRLSLGTILNSKGEGILDVYDVIGIDRTSHNFGTGSHLMVLKVQKGAYNPETDDIVNDICDVYQPKQDEKDPGETGQAIIEGRNNIRLGTSAKYTAVFIDSNQLPISNAIPSWTVTIPQGSSITHTITDGALALTVPLKETEVGNVITIKVTDTDGLYGEYIKKVQVIPIG